MSGSSVVSRVGSYPLVSSAVGSLGEGLEWAKSSGYGLGTAAQWAEWLGGLGLGLGQRLAESGPGEKASKALAARLPALEAALPGLTMNAKELKGAYYDGSHLAGLVHSAGDWAAQTKTTAAALGDGGAGKAVQLLSTSTHLLHGLLARTEAWLDERLTPASFSAAGRDGDASLWGRLVLVSAKASAGLRAKLPSAEEVASAATLVGKTAKAVGSRLLVGPETALMGLLKLLFSLSSSLSAKAVDVCPQPLAAPNQRVSLYLQGLNLDVQASQGLGEVGGKLWTELKSGKDSALNAFDSAAKDTPLSWIHTSSKAAAGEFETSQRRFPSTAEES